MYLGVQLEQSNLPAWCQWIVLGFLALTILGFCVLEIERFFFSPKSHFDFQPFDESKYVEQDINKSVSVPKIALHMLF